MLELCRLCLSTNVKLFNIFGKNDADWSNIAHYILHFFSVEISKSDRVSTKVCRECINFILMCCKKRIKFRENDKFIRSISVHKNGEHDKLQVRNCHPSVNRLLKQYPSLKVPHGYYQCNFNARVNMTQNNTCWRGTFPILKRSLKRKMTRNRKTDGGLRAKTKRIDSVPEIEANNEEVNRLQTTASESSTSNKRHIQKTRMYGDPIMYEELDLDPVLLVEAIQSIPFQDSHSKKSHFRPKPLECSEDAWNNFHEKFYEHPEMEMVKVEEELLTNVVERRVYLCSLCDSVFYNEHDLNTHLQHHDNSPLSDIQFFQMFNSML